MNSFEESGFFLKKTKEGVFAFSENHPNIRVKKVSYYNSDIDKYVKDYSFEIFKKPFWFGWFRRKRWEWAMQTNDFVRGLSFSNYLLKQ